MIIYSANKTPIQIDPEDRHLFEGKCVTIAVHGYVSVAERTGEKTDGGWYKYKKSYAHRLIMKAPKGLQVDHINGDRTDNRKSNLRLCKNASNNRNKGPFSGKYKGVHFSKKLNKWVAQITKNRKMYHIGVFADQDEAARAYNKMAKKLHEKYAFINIVEGGQ